MGGKKEPGYTLKYQHRLTAKYQQWARLIAAWPAPKNTREKT